jgi:hypothetical protein
MSYYDSNDSDDHHLHEDDCTYQRNNTMSMDDVVEHLTVMRRQELAYMATDYLSLLVVDDDENDVDSDNDVIMKSTATALRPASPQDVKVMIDQTCRTAMSDWMFTVVDTLKLPREAAMIAMSYVDRFLSSRTPAASSSLQDRTEFQLTCMSCFYLAVKIHSPVAIDPQLVSQLSRGTFAVKQIEQREVDILMTLKWKVNPPTATSFISLYHEILVSKFQHQQHHDDDHHDIMYDAVVDLAKYQAEVSTNNYKLSVADRPSFVALAALANALDSIDTVDTVEQQEMIQTLSLMAGVNITQDRVDELFTVRTCLYEAVMSGNGANLEPKSNAVRNTTMLMNSSGGWNNNNNNNNKHIFYSGSPRSVTQQQEQHVRHHQHQVTVP